MKKFFLVFSLGIIAITSSNSLFAQSSDGSTEDSPNSFLPAAPGSTDPNYETNIYLQNDAPKQTTQQVKSKAQVSNGKLAGVYEGTTLACPYSFERDLYVGVKGEDVRLLQVLLNSDKRTIIAIDGPGSPGKETTIFGQSTKNAVKKFQALFIEYVGVANGRFGPRSRTVLNAICNGDTSSKTQASYDTVQSVQANATPAGEVTEVPNDKIAPRVSLSANLNAVQVGNTFKVTLNASEEISPITPDSVIVDGGSVKEIRKLSKTSYSVVITPNEDAKNVMVQIEADKISDLAGNTNENASNEINVRVVAAGTSTNDPNNLNNLVDKIVSSAPQCNYDQQGNLINVNPTNGQQVNTTGCAPTKTNYAAYNSSLNCYADNGPLPTGVSEVQRCSNPQNPNNPNSPCSAQNQANYQNQLVAYQQQINNYGYGYGYMPPPPTNPCTNPTVANATQQAALQNQQAARQAAQQQAQNQQLGQLLGGLLGKGLGSGGLGNLFGGNKNGGQTGGGGNPGPGSNPDPKSTPAQTPAEIQKDIGQLTNEYGSKCNTAEKQKTQECTDIEKEINYLTKEYVQTSLEKKVDEACDTEKSNKSACIAALNEVVKSECGKDEVSSACSAAKSELAKQQEKGSGQSPQSGEGTMDLTKECPFLYDNKDNPIDKGDSTKINNAYFISTVDKQTNKKYYLFGTIYTKSGSFDATQTTFSSEKSKLTKVADSGYCCIKKRTKPRNAPLTTCQNRLEVNGPIYKASGQSIEFVK